VRREGVEDLVRDDEPGDRGTVVDVDAVGEADARESVTELVEPARLHLDGSIANDRSNGGSVGCQARKESRGEGAAPRAELADRELRWPPEGQGDVVDVASERLSEDRVGLRRREKVAAPPRPRSRRPVVAGLRVVVRELHEAGERHRPRLLDLGANPLDQTGVALDSAEVGGRDAPQLRTVVHAIRSGAAVGAPAATPDR
jgi:hypothetical protein